MKPAEKYGTAPETGIDKKILAELGDRITTLPTDFDFHPQVKKIYELRNKSIAEGKGIDWGTAESLAFGTIISEGFRIRFSG